ncbi:MAG: TetR/AcrR family transcriptional regulator [Acholeplasmatales bacterium]|nr:TetR/AcrR family transcriptional regulator [Acholeplasmatales bacterium]
MAEIKTNKKARESQRHIYKGLRQILLRKPLAEITVQDISEECNISRSTFYRNFDNVIDVLDVMFDYFYKRYLTNKVGQPNQLLFFFEYWIKHRDLVTIISHQHESIIKNCIKRYEIMTFANPYLIDIKCSILSSLLSRWSSSKKETPEEMEKLTKKILNQKCIDILLRNEQKM